MSATCVDVTGKMIPHIDPSRAIVEYRAMEECSEVEPSRAMLE